MSARGGRELALHLLYQMEVRGETLDQVLPAVLDFLTPEPDSRALAVRLVEYVLELREEIDGLVARTARNWDPARFALIDRCVIRLAAAELLRVPESPVAVVIDAAVQLAKSYSTDKSGPFVNGILDPLAKLARGGAIPQEGDET